MFKFNWVDNEANRFVHECYLSKLKQGKFDISFGMLNSVDIFASLILLIFELVKIFFVFISVPHVQAISRKCCLSWLILRVWQGCIY
ncbi:hypothetical protein EUGRSUZ_D01967 [Eucalyptus grandis]|uniref:Uncharacterized protein n=2 Tax=Eucalyptus grandis TaxID=71139 RepID=A0A059CHK6_EUCGR|nr:hypothetical protein EUGRSUZ_D01967 [Eucalyptus grandis]